MIILQKQSDIKKLKHWDAWMAQEYLDVVNNQKETLDTDKISSIHKKWQDLVDAEMNKQQEERIKKKAIL